MLKAYKFRLYPTEEQEQFSINVWEMQDLCIIIV